MFDLGAAVATSIAALAAWAAVLQARKIWSASLYPNLQVQAIGTGRLLLTVFNLGAAPARSVLFIAFTDTERCFGMLPPHGLLRSNESIELETLMAVPANEVFEQKGVLTCLDADGLVHIWNFGGAHKKPRSKLRRRRRSISLEEAVREFFPDIDVEKLKSAKWGVKRSS